MGYAFAFAAPGDYFLDGMLRELAWHVHFFDARGTWKGAKRGLTEREAKRQVTALRRQRLNAA